MYIRTWHVTDCVISHVVGCFHRPFEYTKKSFSHDETAQNVSTYTFPNRILQLVTHTITLNNFAYSFYNITRSASSKAQFIFGRCIQTLLVEQVGKRSEDTWHTLSSPGLELGINVPLGHNAGRSLDLLNHQRLLRACRFNFDIEFIVSSSFWVHKKEFQPWCVTMCETLMSENWR